MTKCYMSLYLQGRSACGVTRSLRTAATRWWSSSSEPSCTPRTANSSTSSAPESQVKYRSYIRTQPEPIKNGCKLPLKWGVPERRRRGRMYLTVCLHSACAWFMIVRMHLCVRFVLNVKLILHVLVFASYKFVFKVYVSVCSCIYNH